MTEVLAVVVVAVGFILSAVQHPRSLARMRRRAARRPRHARVLEGLLNADDYLSVPPSRSISRAAFHAMVEQLDWIFGRTKGPDPDAYSKWADQADTTRQQQERRREARGQGS